MAKLQKNLDTTLDYYKKVLILQMPYGLNHIIIPYLLVALIRFAKLLGQTM